jgi:hypothetical protein
VPLVMPRVTDRPRQACLASDLKSHGLPESLHCNGFGYRYTVTVFIHAHASYIYFFKARIRLVITYAIWYKKQVGNSCLQTCNENGD